MGGAGGKVKGGGGCGNNQIIGDGNGKNLEVEIRSLERRGGRVYGCIYVCMYVS